MLYNIYDNTIVMISIMLCLLCIWEELPKYNILEELPKNNYFSRPRAYVFKINHMLFLLYFANICSLNSKNTQKTTFFFRFTIVFAKIWPMV